MARPLWKGTLAFGLVSIPVTVHTAVRDVGPHFHFLRRSDKSRVGYQKVAKKDGRPVTKEELVRGFEYEKGRYVVLTGKDFEAAAVKRNDRIDLLDFVSGSDVDDRYFDKPYYLLPARGGEKAYVLLREALRESSRIGIAKLVMRDTPHLAAVEACGDALVLSTLRFREEVVPLSEYTFPKLEVRKPELTMANQLIDGLSAEWDPDKYTNEYRANLLRIIDAKRRNTTPELERQEAETDSNVVDLMERLRRSLAGTAGTRKGARTKKTAAPGAGKKSGGRRTASARRGGKTSSRSAASRRRAA